MELFSRKKSANSTYFFFLREWPSPAGCWVLAAGRRQRPWRRGEAKRAQLALRERDPEVIKVVEAVLLPQAALPDEGAGAAVPDVTGLTAEGDGEAQPRELAHGQDDDGALPPAQRQPRDLVDLMHEEPRGGQGPDGDGVHDLAAARAERPASLGRGPRRRPGEELRAARDVHGGAGVEDDLGRRRPRVDPAGGRGIDDRQRRRGGLRLRHEVTGDAPPPAFQSLLVSSPSLLFDSRDACAAGGIPVTIPPACLARSAGPTPTPLTFSSHIFTCSAHCSSLRNLKRRCRLRVRAHLAAADLPFKRRAMAQLREYRMTMTSKDGLEDEGDYWWSLSLSLSSMHTFFRQVNILICLLLHRLMHMAMSRMHMFLSVDGGRPLSSRGSSEEQGVSKIYVLSEQPMSPLLLILWLDSGATHHAVGDARILCNLRDPPAGTAVRAADGVRLLVHKIGDILTQCIKIQDVYLVLGLQENLISVRQLAKDKKIVTIFYENYAELWREGKMVGGAIADNVTSLYQLRYLTMPTGDPEAGTSRYIREEAMDVATARGATNRSSFLQLLSLSTSTSTESKMILNMFSAAADSTYTRRLVWAMAELINHPHEMRRVQAEIRKAIVAAGDDDVTEDDLELLPYHKQVIKEMLRLCTPVPLLLPRETMEDTEHLGYHVPARTHIFFNAWAISRDPAVWRSADEFMPERFADDDMKTTTTEYLLGQDFDEFVPFGASWRRGCSGVGFAAPAMELELALASLLYHFGWELPAGRPPAAPKDELSVRLKTTLHLVAKPWSSQ